MTAAHARVEDLVMRIQGDFLDHPALKLTLTMAQERFGMDDATCAGVLGALVEARVLRERHGVYSRRFPHPETQQAA